MSRIPFLLVLLLAAAAATAEDITTVPNPPAAGQPFEVRINSAWGDSCRPQPYRVLIANHDIYAYFSIDYSGGCLSAVSAWQATVNIPPLDAGTYQMHARLATSDVKPLFDKTIVVAGTPSGISFSPSFDRAVGNRVVHIKGSFPGAMPAVLFGSKAATAVERVSENEIEAVVPLQTNIRTVNVTVRGDGYTYVLPSGFTYVSDDEYEAILIPITTRSAKPGAHGSLWTSDVRMVNRAGVALLPGVDFFPSAAAAPLTPKRVVSPSFVLPRADVDDPPTALMYVRSEFVPLLSFESRTRDLSRASETWGTEIPVVRERDMRWTLTLLDVPTTSGFRSTLRLYTADFVGCCRSTVTFYSNDGDVLATRSVSLLYPNGASGGLVPPPYVREGSAQFPLQPAYAQLDLQSIPEIEGYDRIWIVVNGNGRIWGFVSVTNDATQHVTTITPR
jgi:hypothetical protein